MVYSTSRCPICKKVIKRETNPVHKIGVPFARCQWCGYYYRDSYTSEWITKSPFQRFFFFLNSGVCARAFIVPVFLLIALICIFNLSREFTLIAWPILSTLWLIVGYFVHKKANRKDIVASLERTKDPQYLDTLKRAGYTIYPIDPSN